MISRRTILTAPLLTPILARNWDRATFPDWSPDHIDKLLTDSPWARPHTLPFRFSAPAPINRFDQIGEPLGFPKGWPTSSPKPTNIPIQTAPPVQSEIYLTTRWSSALPIRQALALHQFGRAGLQSAHAASLLNESPDEYILDVAGFPAGSIPQGARRFEAELLQSATINVKGHKPLHATAVSVPEHGNHLVATIRFPRKENFAEQPGFIEFTAHSGPMDIRQKFKLQEMTYKGRLEL
jgi:hypothetical protein